MPMCSCKADTPKWNFICVKTSDALSSRARPIRWARAFFVFDERGEFGACVQS
jgi:hypothetical protein